MEMVGHKLIRKKPTNLIRFLYFAPSREVNLLFKERFVALNSFMALIIA
jgi:hypothetical protein